MTRWAALARHGSSRAFGVLRSGTSRVERYFTIVKLSSRVVEWPAEFVATIAMV